MDDGDRGTCLVGLSLIDKNDPIPFPLVGPLAKLVKALDYESRDCRFESCVGHLFDISQTPIPFQPVFFMTIFNEWFPLWIGLIILFLCCLIPFLIPKPNTPNYSDLITGRRRPGSTSFESLNIKKRSVTGPTSSLHGSFSRSPSDDNEEVGSTGNDMKKDKKQYTATHGNPDKLLAEWEIKVTFITGSLVCCYVMWACAYLAQVNPMITPIYKDVHK